MRYTKSSWLIIMIVLSLVLSACNLGQEPEPTPDVGAIFTAAAETVMAEFSVKLTQTAQAVPTATQAPTNTAPATFAVVSPGAGSPVVPATTPLATFGIGTQPAAGVLPTMTSAVAVVPTTGDTCYNSEWIQDVTYDDTVTKPVLDDGTRILKVWRVKNTGTCTWDDGFALIQYSGDNMNATKWEITAKSSSKDFVKPGDIIDISVELTVPSTAGEHGGCWRMMGDGGYYFGTSLCFNFMVE